MKAAAIIVAGGSGKRFGSKTPKQFLKLCAKPVFMWSIETFLTIKDFKQIILVVPQDMTASLSKKYLNSNFIITAGGKERFDSVKNGLSLLEKNIEFVAIHDAARPLIDKKDIISVLKTAKKTKAAIAAEKTKDTIKTVKNGFAEMTLDRSTLWNVQTPQIFEAKLLKKAYSGKIPKNTTDDSQLIENMNIKVAVVETKSSNFKITAQQDFEAAKNILSKRKC